MPRPHPDPRTAQKNAIPRLRVPDSTLSLLREGYGFISRRCDRLGTDAFRTRLMGSRVVAMRGAEAARLVYGSGRFGRWKAMPVLTLRLLQDHGSVQLLEGGAHRVRKGMFLDLMTPLALDRARTILAREFRIAAGRWRERGEVVLMPAFREILTRTACAWASVPLAEEEVAPRVREFGAMTDAAGSVGPANWRAQRLRNRSEAWARALIDRVRSRAIAPGPDSPLAVIANHRDSNGALLDRDHAGVELLNLLRPTVAIDRFLTFTALALHQHPHWAEAFAGGNEGDIRPFVQEVRRTTPFFPAIGARAMEATEWHGHRFAAGDWVILDLYGTNRHPGLWESPESFRPERFRDWQGDPFTLIPQGGGHFEDGHRCPGEWLTIALMEEAVRFLTRGIRYMVPPQDLSVPLSRMPTQPRSGMVIRAVRPA